MLQLFGIGDSIYLLVGYFTTFFVKEVWLAQFY